MEVSPSDGGIAKINQYTPASYPANFKYDGGEQVEVEAVPAAGFVFNGWGGAFSGSNNPVTVTMDCNKYVVANFNKLGEYLLTTRVNGVGSTNPPEGTHSYVEKTVVEITATAEKGWRFDGWTGDVADLDTPTTTVKMDADKTCTANFSRIMHVVNMQVNGQGTTIPSPGTSRFGEGATIYISAVPAKGWRFDGWTGSVADAKSPDTTVLVASDGIYTANFSRANSMAWFAGGGAAVILVIAAAVWFAVRRRT